MDENKLFLLSLFFAFAGIALLFFLTKNLSPVEVQLDEISSEDLGRFVLVKGKATSFYSSQAFASFYLCSSKCVKTIVFNKQPTVSEGAFVSVEGRVSEFGGRLEIIADSVEVLKV